MASCRTRGEELRPHPDGRAQWSDPGLCPAPGAGGGGHFVPEPRSGDCICVQIPGPITPATFQVAEGHNQPCGEEQKHKN